MNGLSWSTASSTGAPLFMSGQTPTHRPLDNPTRPVNFTALGLASLVENPICQEFSSGEFKQATHPVPAFPRTAVGPVRRL